jgi:uncharacterized membrane protein YeaQ/YmgE (transglycosylase-associated protein family)
VLGTIIGLIVIGVVAAFIARAIVPGAQLMSSSEKVALGIAGSFVGGLGGRILLHHGRGFVQLSSWIGSIIGSLIVLTIYMHVQQRRA